MTAKVSVLRQGPVSVFDYRCGAGPADLPFVEHHECFSISYVRKGSFGCRTQGEAFELVPGALMIGHPGAPGLRADYSATYYAAFLIDPDGNNVEAVWLR